MRSSPKIEAEYFSLKGASDYVGGAYSPREFRRLISRPDGLPHYRVGPRGKILIRKADLDAFLAAHRREPVDLDTLAHKVLRELAEKP